MPWEEAGDDAAAAIDREGDGNEPSTVADEGLVVASILDGTADWDALRRLRRSDFADAGLGAAWAAMSMASVAGTAPTLAALAALDPSLDARAIGALRGRGGGAAVAAAAAGRMVCRRRMAAAAAGLRAAAGSLEEGLAGRRPPGAGPWQTELGEALAMVAGLAGSDEAVDGDELEARVIRHIAARTPPIPTGIARLDEFLGGGLRPATMVAIGGQTKVGKTVLIATVSHNLAHAVPPVPHLLVTLERSAEEVARLKLARRMGIGANGLDRLDDAGLTRLRALGRESTACRTMHAPGASVEDVAAEASYQVKARGARAVLVDHLQLTGGARRGENDEQHMTRVSQAFADMAARLRVPVLIGVQVDPMGQVWRRANAIAQSANAFLVINRDRDSTAAYLETLSSNLGDESDVGTISAPSMTLDPAGPHFRSPGPREDAGSRGGVGAAVGTAGWDGDP